jgi:hypothetical protein
LNLGRLIKDAPLAPDYILCAGDIINRSSPTDFNYAWARLLGDALSQFLEWLGSPWAKARRGKGNFGGKLIRLPHCEGH